MRKEEFYLKLVDGLDLDDKEINENSALHLTSLMHLSLISFLDENFGIRAKAIDLKDIDSVAKLMSFIGKEKFE